MTYFAAGLFLVATVVLYSRLSALHAAMDPWPTPRVLDRLTRRLLLAAGLWQYTLVDVLFVLQGWQATTSALGPLLVGTVLLFMPRFNRRINRSLSNY